MNNKNLIIHVVQKLAPGGIEVLALNMLTRANVQEKVLIISLEESANRAIENWPLLEPLKSQLIFLNKPAGHSFTTLVQLVKLFQKLKPDVVHTHHIGPLIYGSIAARLAGVKSRIHTEHDAWHLNSPKHRLLQRNAIRFAKPIIVADAELVKQQLEKHLGLASSIVIKNGIDSSIFTPSSKAKARRALHLPQNGYLVGSAGRLEKVKGHSLLIDSLTSLPQQVHIVLAGDGSELQALKQQVASLNLQQRVHFLGRVDDMPTFYQSLDLFCLPSLAEGFPLSTLEAQSCDVVTIATDVGAVKETLCPDSSILVSKPCSELIAQAIKQTFTQSAKTDKHCSPRRFIERNGDIQQMLNAYRLLFPNLQHPETKSC